MHSRIHKTERETFWIWRWWISPLKAKPYSLCLTDTKPPASKFKVQARVSQQIPFECLSHLILIEKNCCTVYILRRFDCCQSCEVHCCWVSLRMLPLHQAIGMWGRWAWTSPRATQEIPEADHGVLMPTACAPCPSSVGFSNSSMPSASLCPKNLGL